jgi:hypothetical protein
MIHLSVPAAPDAARAAGNLDRTATMAAGKIALSFAGEVS